GGVNIIRFIVTHDSKDPNVQNALKFINDLVRVTKYNLFIKEITYLKENFEKYQGKGIIIKSGYGLKPNEKPIKNKYFVNTDLLKDHGILEIRYIKHRHLARVKPPMLSENCKHCVVEMINGGKINLQNFVSLNNFEKDLLRKIDSLFETGQNLHDDDEDNMHKNFELLKGSYLAGNNNSLIKEQLRAYISHAHELGKISRWTRDKILHELKLI
ncbi:MAG: hypothetical protein K2P99_07225, partial [Burkholderiales bacterium]|nr:hypothetical protein [Burkholderiales bacterium]